MTDANRINKLTWGLAVCESILVPYAEIDPWLGTRTSVRQMWVLIFMRENNKKLD